MSPVRRGKRLDRSLSPRVGRALVRWFRDASRPLPWRSSRDPYRIWVAEVLLQQTRVAQAVPYFERFVRRFPSVETLAAATTEQVLKVWQGAGYYGRARRLHAAAREVVRRFGGRVPREVEVLESLPGVGPYIARAIASLAFDAPVVALEANGLRVAARWLAEPGAPSRAAVRTRLERALCSTLPVGAAGAFNEGLMELGETICTPLRPLCPVCPVARECRAFRELEDPASLPHREARKRRPHVRASVVVIRSGGRWLLQRRPPTGLLGGLWEFPGGKIRPGEPPADAARREVGEEVGVRLGPRLDDLGVVRHGYSHFTVELHVFAATVSRPVAAGPDRRWCRPSELAALPLPRATEKIVERLLARPRPDVTGGGRPDSGRHRSRPGARRASRDARRPTEPRRRGPRS